MSGERPRADGIEWHTDTSWRVSTPLNGCTDRVAQFLLGGFSEHILGLYRTRAEQAKITR